MKREDVKNKIENVFRNSSSFDEIFDAFTEALKNKIKDVETYKILLANSCLDDDELKLFADRLNSHIPENKYELNIWTAKVFAGKSFSPPALESSFHYFKKATEIEPVESEPLLGMLSLYNYDLDLPVNSMIEKDVRLKVENIKMKKEVYRKLAVLYKKKGDVKMENMYLTLLHDLECSD